MKKEDFICEASSKIFSARLGSASPEDFRSPIYRSDLASDAVNAARTLAERLVEFNIVAWPKLDKPSA